MGTRLRDGRAGSGRTQRGDFLDGSGGDSLEDMLHALLDAKADRVGRKRRIPPAAPAFVTGRAGRSRTVPMEAAIIERRRRQQNSVEETMLEICHADVSVSQAERITNALWGARVSPATVRELNRRIGERIEAWRHRPIGGRHIYVFLSAVELRSSGPGLSRPVDVLAAVGVSSAGAREVLGVTAGDREDLASWQAFLHSLRQRGLTGVKLFVSDQNPGLAANVAALFPGAVFQDCVLQFYRRVLSLVPLQQVAAVEEMLKGIHACTDHGAALARGVRVMAVLRSMGLRAVAAAVAADIGRTLSYYSFPPAHRRHLRSNDLLNQIMREIRERTRVVTAFSDSQSAVLLVGARLRHIAGRRWARRDRLDMRPVRPLLEPSASEASA